LRLKTLRVNKKIVVPIAVVALLAAGTTAAAASGAGHERDSQHRASAASHNREVESARRHRVRPPTAPPVTVVPTTPTVDPTTPVATTTTPVPTTTTPVPTTTTPVPTTPVPTTTTPGTSLQAPVNLGSAASFAILSKAGITDVPASKITGNVGSSPITGAAIGLTCPEVTGTIYSVDATGPLACRVTDPTLLTTAVSDEELAYTDAAGRTNPDSVDLGAGEIGGMTLTPGLYKWNTGLSISTDVTLTGGANDVFIFQVAGTLNEAAAKNVILSGGVQAKNVFWQSAGGVTIGTTAHFEGTILGKTAIAMNTGASTNGSLLAQTAVTLDQNTVTLK
jgi:Ice-binding-like